MTLEELKKLLAELIEADDKNPIAAAIEEAFKQHDYDSHEGYLRDQ